MVNLTRQIREFTDISLAFEPNPFNGDISVLKNDRAIVNALKNCVLIASREAPFDPDFGSTVNDYLFDLEDPFTEYDLETEVRRTIEYNEPRVEVSKVKASSSESNEMRISITYNIIGYDEVFNVDFLLTSTSA